MDKEKIIESRHHHFVHDSNLTVEAFGTLSYLLSLPTGADFSQQLVQERFRCGSTKMLRVFQELKREGYMSIARTKNEDNHKFASRGYTKIVSNCPDFTEEGYYLPEGCQES